MLRPLREAYFLNPRSVRDRAFLIIAVSGMAFGELALINKDCIRNASIVADERTDLLVVNRELFNRSLCSAQAADFEARTRFANEHPLFKQWPYKHRKQLAMSIRREKLQFDQLIVKQGVNANALFFLIK